MTREVDYKIVDVLLSSGLLPKDARQQSTFHECVHELSSLPMSRLSSEPAYLRDCHKTIVRDSHKWAYENYDVFIQTAECTRQIFDDFEKVQLMDDGLTNKIPDLLVSGHKFIDECRQLMAHASMNTLTLQKHNQILEILEIPQLLEACIRNNYLDEALELIAYSRKLERRLGNIAIISNVTQEARLAAQKLLQQLFQQLGGDLQLPSCLKIVGYLRRMDCLPESLLRLKFLQCRDNYLLGLLRGLASNDPFYHATKYMEVTRVNLFDIATQYRAVFNDEDIYISNVDSLGQQHIMLFSSWLVMRVDIFINNLAADVNTIIDNSLSYNISSVTSQSTSQSVGSKLQSLLGQSMYFGLSLSRIGCDFRPLLLPVFYQTVMKFINMRLLEIADSFSDCISNYKWTVDVEDLSAIAFSFGLEYAKQQFLADRSEEIIAPVNLMNHPLLALLLNQILSILEDIRLCCPKVLRKRICQSFVDTVTLIMKSLLKFHEEEGPNFTAKEQQSFVNMIMSFLLYFIPHVDLCLTLLFSSEEFSGKSGDSVDVRTLNGMFSDLLPSSFFATFNEEESDLNVNQEDIMYYEETEKVVMKGVNHSLKESAPPEVSGNISIFEIDSRDEKDAYSPEGKDYSGIESIEGDLKGEGPSEEVLDFKNLDDDDIEEVNQHLRENETIMQKIERESLKEDLLGKMYDNVEEAAEDIVEEDSLLSNSEAINKTKHNIEERNESRGSRGLMKEREKQEDCGLIPGEIIDISPEDPALGDNNNL